MTHIDNVPSILNHGILSHEQVEARKIRYTSIYDTEIVSRRRGKMTPDGLSLWHYANLYFQPRNPMLYRVLLEGDNKSKIVIIHLRKDLLTQPGLLLSTGNAAHSASEIRPYSNQTLREISRSLDLDYWSDTDGTKRKIMAECLIPESVPPQWIDCVYVSNDAVANKARALIEQAHRDRDVSVIIEPRMFFQPDWQRALTDKLFLAQGDMFFSRMQTLTISVNVRGVMGKGLASRAKYQFPDVYVRYQDLCKQKKLQAGKPALVVRESSLMSELAETPYENGISTWFLLFPTKKHWKEDSKIEYVIDGLSWLEQNYKNLKIQSLALPALGCGLGNLEWKDVGPIMCSTVAKFDIPVCVYLPTEKPTEKEYLTREFLLRS
jgi:O-acetyl-ADP-ribose deacetylase (regulator of RNase III)